MAEHRQPVMIGTAGWSVPAGVGAAFPVEGSHLLRYAARFPAVEINTSFYRPHRPATYARWANSVPEHFRFAVKLPRAVTHAGRLIAPEAPLERFLDETAALGARRGPLLVQLPPSLGFDPGVAAAFLRALRARFAGQVACEPRHASWFAPSAEALLAEFEVARVAADPAVVPAAAHPGGWPGFTYRRLHGSPDIYRSPYPQPFLAHVAERIAGREGPAWCILDNTATGAAAGDALALLAMCEAGQPMKAAAT
ncbi:MAG TPA: DUF72 domain-containing protein [Roseococcus sp.]|jgi:uncharacterized protein YecE (DUF72 family)|nr:DUF72 domain-containing protein [Roseococcus sp.]